MTLPPTAEGLHNKSGLTTMPLQAPHRTGGRKTSKLTKCGSLTRKPTGRRDGARSPSTGRCTRMVEGGSCCGVGGIPAVGRDGGACGRSRCSSCGRSRGMPTGARRPTKNPQDGREIDQSRRPAGDRAKDVGNNANTTRN